MECVLSWQPCDLTHCNNFQVHNVLELDNISSCKLIEPTQSELDITSYHKILYILLYKFQCQQYSSAITTLRILTFAAGDWAGALESAGDVATELDFLTFFFDFLVGGVVNSLLVASVPCCFVSVCVLVSSALSSGTTLNFIFASEIAVAGGTLVALLTGSSPDVSAVTQQQQLVRICKSPIIQASNKVLLTIIACTHDYIL
jgi:hypothetical protein